MQYYFCYAPQRRGVEHFLSDTIGARLTTRSIVSVDRHDCHKFYGIRNGTFIHFKNTSGPAFDVPQRIWEALQIQGFTVVSIDDGWTRDRYGR